MNRSELRNRFDKVYTANLVGEDDVTELIVDLFNYMSSSQLEEFYEFILEEKDLTDKQVQNLD